MDKKEKKEIKQKLDSDYRKAISGADSDIARSFVDGLFCEKYKMLKKGENPYKESKP